MINKNSNTQVALPDKISLPSPTTDVNHNQTVMETEEQKVLNSSNSSITALVPGGVVTTQNISTVIRPKGNSNSLQFVKIQTPELSKKAVEQIRIADETKISKEKIKEVEEEWQNNLLNWKSKRRQQLSHSVDIHEQADPSLDNNNDCGTRKVKTFAEMIEQRAKSGNRLSFHLQRYASTDGDEDEDDGDDDGDEDDDAGGDDDSGANSTMPPQAQVSPQRTPSISPKIVPKSTPSAAITRLTEIAPPQEPQPEPNHEDYGDAAVIPDIEPMVQTSPLRKTSTPPKIVPKSPLAAAITPLAEVTSSRGPQPKPSREDFADAAANLAMPPMVQTAPSRAPSIPPKTVPKFPPSAAIPDMPPVAQTSPQRTPNIPPKIIPKSHPAAAITPLTSITSPREPQYKPNREDYGDTAAIPDMPPMAQTSPLRTTSIPPKTVPRFSPAAPIPDIPPIASPQRTPSIPPKIVPKSSLPSAIPPLAGITPTQEIQPKPKREDKDKTVLSISGKKRCSSCKEELGRGAAAFVVESLSLVYHTNCFRCSVCHMNLSNGFRGVDVRVHAGQLHCQNCYSKDGLSYSRV